MEELRRRLALALYVGNSRLDALLNNIKEIEGPSIRNQVENWLGSAGVTEIDDLEYAFIVALEEALAKDAPSRKPLLETQLSIPIITDGVKLVLITNVTQAAKDLGLNRTSLSGVISGVRGSVGGWKLYNSAGLKLQVV